MHPIPYPLKTSENRKVFWCFQGLQKGYTGYERINKYWNSTENHTLSLLFQIYINFEIRSGEKPKLKSHDRAYPSCFMHAIVARMRLPKIFSNFVHFCSNFQIFCPFLTLFPPFLPFFWKITCMPLLSKIGPDLQILATESPLKIMENYFYFTLKALFVLKILKFVLNFWSCRKTTWLER